VLVVGGEEESLSRGIQARAITRLAPLRYRIVTVEYPVNHLEADENGGRSTAVTVRLNDLRDPLVSGW